MHFASKNLSYILLKRNFFPEPWKMLYIILRYFILLFWALAYICSISCKRSMHFYAHVMKQCRQAKLTYAGKFLVDIYFQYADGAPIREKFNFGQFPIMLKVIVSNFSSKLYKSLFSYHYSNL